MQRILADDGITQSLGESFNADWNEFVLIVVENEFLSKRNIFLNHDI